MRTQGQPGGRILILVAAVLCILIFAAAAYGEKKTETGDKSQKDKLGEQKMKITRIYTGQDGESHFADADIPLPKAVAGLNRSETQKTGGVIFLETSGSFDFHRAPCKQYVIFLDGGVEIETGDGTKKTFNGGDILLVEDTTGHGHIIRTPDGKPHRSIFITLD